MEIVGYAVDSTAEEPDFIICTVRVEDSFRNSKKA